MGFLKNFNQYKLHKNEFLQVNIPKALFESSYYLIMTNTNTMDARIAMKLWDNFDCKICADGGANRLYDGLSDEKRSVIIPDYIVGDLDSIRQDVKEFYQSKGCQIVYDYDQDYNDMDKSLKLATSDKCLSSNPSLSPPSSSSSSKKKPISVVLLGAFGGRFDQEMATIHALYKWKTTFSRIIMIDNMNIAYLLGGSSQLKQRDNNGNNILLNEENIQQILQNKTDNASSLDDIESYPPPPPLICHRIEGLNGLEGPTCSLMPIGNPIQQIWTEGLHWNLHGQTLKMGELISSSNYVEYNNNNNNNNNNDNNKNHNYTCMSTSNTNDNSDMSPTTSTTTNKDNNNNNNNNNNCNIEMNGSHDAIKSSYIHIDDDITITNEYNPVYVLCTDDVIWSWVLDKPII